MSKDKEDKVIKLASDNKEALPIEDQLISEIEKVLSNFSGKISNMSLIGVFSTYVTILTSEAVQHNDE